MFVSLLPKIMHCWILCFISLITYSFRADFRFGRFLSFFKNLLFCFSNIMSHSYKFFSKDTRFLSIDEFMLFGLLEILAFGPVKKHYEASSEVLTAPGFSIKHGAQSASYWFSYMHRVEGSIDTYSPITLSVWLDKWFIEFRLIMYESFEGLEYVFDTDKLASP